MYYYYDIWAKEDEYGISLPDEFTTMIMVDSKSIQNADTAEVKGYDAGKKIRNKAAYSR